MKRTITLICCLLYSFFAVGQTRINAGIGYFGENISNPGIVLEFEYEKMHAEDFSIPIRADFGLHSNPGFNALTFDVHTGFRKYFESGFMLEQAIGLGLIGKKFKNDIWFFDDYSYGISHGNKTVIGFMPSITMGAGYNLSKEKKGVDLIWIRPKIFWDLGFRPLNLPYWALQMGLTHTFKTR
ncbi:hypothetical protein [Algoriphagus sp.]|uniref:hypothetical protein n=1 Tax=Algoriphagus sp. TaxID=1872435 RepID=UPI0025D2C355|nr:hypothetical protein [Algoriphagus sp.]